MTNAGKIEEATPRPWSVLDDHPIKAVLHIVSAENNTDVAASVYGCDGYQDQDGIWRDQHKRQATAELIVRAVNSYDPALQDKLTKAVKALDEVQDYIQRGGDLEELGKIVSAALRQIKESEHG